MLTVNLETCTVTENGSPIILEGKPVNNYQIRKDPVTFDELEKLYDNYKHSVPNGIKYLHNYFKALSVTDLSVDDMVNGENRQTAKEKLEMALLEGILNKSLKWPDDRKWFWQSKNDKDFVLLRKWFQKGEIYAGI